MKPQSKLRVITPSALRDCSTYNFQFTSFLKYESHNKISNADHSGEYQEVLAGKRQLRLFDHWQLSRI